MRILIASPVRQQTDVLSEFLASVTEQDADGILFDYLFTDDNDTDEASRLLRSFSRPRSITSISPAPPKVQYSKDEHTHYWNEHAIWRLAAIKDDMIRAAIEGDYDALMLIDSDLILHPRTVKHLTSLQLPIVSEIFWTKWQPNTLPLPNVWIKDLYTLYEQRRGEQITSDETIRRTEEFLSMLRKPGVYPVGGLGACTLIAKKALRAGVSFREVPNISFWGEDRHFCVRSMAIGIPLYVDTSYPAYHIYRNSELAGAPAYKLQCGLTTQTISHSPAKTGSRLVLSILVKNEADRYLSEVLDVATECCDAVAILDDASTDRTPDVCRKRLAGLESKIVVRSESGFGNEVQVRRELWDLALSLKPDWVLCLDADEILGRESLPLLKSLIARPELTWIGMRLFDMWSETHYRDDELWNAHRRYYVPLVRVLPEFDYKWREAPLHCGRLPVNSTEGFGVVTSIRVKHMGWAKETDRLLKYRRYMESDGHGQFGSLLQYQSILDQYPNLTQWETPTIAGV